MFDDQHGLAVAGFGHGKIAQDAYLVSVIRALPVILCIELRRIDETPAHKAKQEVFEVARMSRSRWA